MLLRVSHLTRYYYSRAVNLLPHRIYLRPRETAKHRLHRFRLDFAPIARIVPTRDEHDNDQIWAYWSEATAAANIQSEFEIETLDANPFDFLLRSDAMSFPFSYEEGERAALAPYLALPDPDTESRLRRWIAERMPTGPSETLAFVAGLNSQITSSIAYTRRDEHGILPSLQTLERGSGSCRDSATLLVDGLRTLGLAARFVSGYLYEPRSKEAAEEPPTAMHAWAEVYLPGAGWRGLDPTRGIFCNDAFIPVAHASRGESVSPVQGSFAAAGPVSSELHADIVVEKVG
jgi:transglutaminase-like putative cysteine protease